MVCLLRVLLVDMTGNILFLALPRCKACQSLTLIGKSDSAQNTINISI